MDYSNVVEHVPQGCFFCGSHNGPYIDTAIVDPTIQTADGPVVVRGRVALCIGIAERPGCAVQIGRAAGLISTDALARLNELGATKDKLIENLQEQVEELRDSQVQVVSVDELETRLAEHV